MQYTPQQAMSAVGISQQTLRYWRKVLPPLGDRDGYKACFSLADLLALKVFFVLINEAGIAVGAVAKIAQAIFDACAIHAPLSIGPDTTLVICPRTGSVRRSFKLEQHALGELEIVVPLSRCVEELFDALQDSSAQTLQVPLPLPLAAVNGRGR